MVPQIETILLHAAQVLFDFSAVRRVELDVIRKIVDQAVQSRVGGVLSEVRTTGVDLRKTLG